MTFEQQDLLHTFLINASEPFSIKDVCNAIKKAAPSGMKKEQIAEDAEHFLRKERAVFPLGNGLYLSRRGLFNDASFVITPSNVELLNGILVPGHRCVPFANPEIPPSEYKFYYCDNEIPGGSTEGDPEDFYPYFSIFGEEFAPEYVANDNPQSAEAFQDDPYDSPALVAIKTIDMRKVYRETGFISGDRLLVSVMDWKRGRFSVERVAKDEWTKKELDEWTAAAEKGFAKSFAKIGPGVSPEEQITWAYWFGGPRMLKPPALSLETFLYETTEDIETVTYGIESRFWYAGKEIPDVANIRDLGTGSFNTPMEQLLTSKNVPVSEFVIHSYVRDAIARRENTIEGVVRRLVPPSITVEQWLQFAMTVYFRDMYKALAERFNTFADRNIAPVRRKAIELHTAIIDLAAQLKASDLNRHWLPPQTMVTLGQLQYHTAAILEELDSERAIDDGVLEALENSIEVMIENYQDLKDEIEGSINSYRLNAMSLGKTADEAAGEPWRVVQFSISGADVWRRLVVPTQRPLSQVHRWIQAMFNWKNKQTHRWTATGLIDSALDRDGGIKSYLPLEKIFASNIHDLKYEYGRQWLVRITAVSTHDPTKDALPVCTGGKGAPPPEHVEGPLRYGRFISALDGFDENEKQVAREALGEGFDPQKFDATECTKAVRQVVD
jgi:hypothetical protein